MKSNFIRNHSKKVFAGITILLFILILIGIFAYFNFFRQHHSDLFDAVPDDAFLIVQINDEAHFLKHAKYILPFFNEIFFFEAYKGCQFISKQAFQKKNIEKSVVSGHTVGERNALLYITSMNAHIFRDLLKKIKIDSRNFIPYNKEKIYTYGTHYKKFYFINHHNVFAVSDNLQLLQNSIDQHRQLQHLTNHSEFKKVYRLIQKNQKQNWLLVNHLFYLPKVTAYLTEKYEKSVLDYLQLHSWSAHQIYFTESEIHLSGYLFPKDSSSITLPKYSTPFTTPTSFLPFETSYIKNINDKVPQTLFSLLKESQVYNYLLLSDNITTIEESSLLAENNSLDSFKLYKNYKVFPTHSSKLKELIQIEYPSLNYFLHYHDYYVFSDSITALKYYVDKMLTSQKISELPLYQLSQNKLPSMYALSSSYYLQNKNFKDKIFAQSNFTLNSYKNIYLFAYTFDSVEDNIISSKIYFKFNP